MTLVAFYVPTLNATLLRNGHLKKKNQASVREHTHTRLNVMSGCCVHCHGFHLSSTVQDVAFQLERLVGGMYVYNRQCYNALKQAAVFPIEVQLSIHPPTPPAIEGEGEEGGGEGANGKAVASEPQEDLLIQTD